ncbi:MAG: hypothetical protein ACO3ND_08140 [Opitutales bacterium]
MRTLLSLGILVAATLGLAQAEAQKPVQVFILMGQSNMLGLGKVSGPDGSLEHAVKTKGLFPYLVDAQGAWKTREDVRNVRVMVGRGGGMQIFNDEWLKVGGRTLGPEYGIGHVLGDAVPETVMLLKSCIGNRSLGWDLLPPGSGRVLFDGKVHAAYKEKPDSWPADPAKGIETPPPAAWLDM